MTLAYGLFAVYGFVLGFMLASALNSCGAERV